MSTGDRTSEGLALHAMEHERKVSTISQNSSVHEHQHVGERYAPAVFARVLHARAKHFSSCPLHLALIGQHWETILQDCREIESLR